MKKTLGKKISNEIKRFTNRIWPNDYRLLHYRDLNFLLDRRNRVDRKIICGGYEEEQIDFLKASCANRYTKFLDIGANIGLYSLQFATLGSIEKIYAFEPDPRNNTQLKSNIFLNDFIDKILVCDYAASDKKAEVSFELYPNHSTGQSRIVESGKSENKVITIPCDTIDNNFDFSNDNIAIKIDVEGNELATLAGAKKLLASNTCIVQIEAWPENAEKLKKYMEDLDYKFLKLIAEDHYFTNDPKLVG